MAQPAPDPDRARRSPPAPRRSGTPAVRPIRRRTPTEAVMGLDMVLVDAARGPLRRMIPPAGTALRFGSALARQPGTVARPGRGAGPRAGRGSPRAAPSWRPGRRTSGSPTRPGRGNPLLRRAMQAAPGHRPHRLGADRGRRPRLAGRRADPVHRDQPRRRPGAEQRAGAQPAVAEGGHRHRRAERRHGAPAVRPRPRRPRRGCRRWSSRTPSPWARTSPPPRAPSSSAPTSSS